MAMVGMDIAAVQALAGRMESTSQEIASIVDGLSAKVAGTSWVGPDRDRFDQAWGGEVPKLKQIAGELSATAQRLRQEADQQAQASGA